MRAFNCFVAPRPHTQQEKRSNLKAKIFIYLKYRLRIYRTLFIQFIEMNAIKCICSFSGKHTHTHSNFISLFLTLFSGQQTQDNIAIYDAVTTTISFYIVAMFLSDERESFVCTRAKLNKLWGAAAQHSTSCTLVAMLFFCTTSNRFDLSAQKSANVHTDNNSNKSVWLGARRDL